MAITLNKLAVQCEEIAIAGGKISTASSARPILYDISRDWRKLCDAAGRSQKEELAADIMIDTLVYLQRIGCKNIEQLLRDSVERHARLIE